MKVRGITIHNTGNELSAKEIYELLKKDKTLNICHYLVDENEVVSVLDESKEAHHTGRGYDFGNRYTLAIEICRSMSDNELYFVAEKNAIKLVKKLMKKYKLSKNDLYFHIDFNENTRCPHRILEIYEKKERFLDEYFV